MKASVIIPAYNVEDYIERCIRSVINQSEEDIEIIVVNDGSKDCTLKKIRNLQKLDTRIKVIDKKNEGVMKARYDGLKLATGDYILFLDGDDWIDKSAIESLWLSAEKNSSDILMYNIYWAYDIKNYYPVKTYEKEYVNKNSNYIEILLLGKISVNIWDKFIKRDFLNKVNLNLDLVYGEDLVNVLNMLIKEPKISFLDKHLYYYYQRNTSITKVIDEKVFQLEKSFDMVKNILIDNKLYDKYIEQYNYLCYLNIFIEKVVFNTQVNNIHERLYYNFKKRKISTNNKYIKEYINNQKLAVRMKIKIFNLNYYFVKIYNINRKILRKG